MTNTTDTSIYLIKKIRKLDSDQMIKNTQKSDIANINKCPFQNNKLQHWHILGTDIFLKKSFSRSGIKKNNYDCKAI